MMRVSVIVTIIVIAACLSGRVFAVAVHASVSDQNGQPVHGAVISLRPLKETAAVNHANTSVIDQRGRAFVPQVIAVATGTNVEFPNSDEMRHHVYSFSKSKRFELKLYSDQSMPSVLFDKPGLVTMGCNIHDWMRGYVYVLDEPYFSVSDESGDVWLDLPAGKYSMVARHPRQKADVESEVLVKDDRDADYTVTVHISTKGELPPQTEPAGGFSAY